MTLKEALKNVIDITVNKEFEILDIDLEQNQAHIYNEEYGSCIQHLDNLVVKLS